MQETGGFRLIVRRGPQPNQTFDLNKDVVTLGRDITNDIVINDPEVSRHHLRFTRGAEGYNMEDLGSTNGTFIGGQRITGVRSLNRGDLIGLGETVTLVYEAIRPDANAAPTMQGPAPQPAPQPDYGQQPAAPAPAPGYEQPAQQQGGYSYDQAQQGGYQQAPQQGGYDPAAPAPPGPDYQQQPGYDEQYPPADYGGYGGAVPGYDPYAIRDEEPVSMWRWVVIGCVGLTFFCCCATIGALVIIDTAGLWDDIPIFSDIVTPIIRSIAEPLGLIN